MKAFIKFCIGFGLLGILMIFLTYKEYSLCSFFSNEKDLIKTKAKVITKEKVKFIGSGESILYTLFYLAQDKKEYYIKNKFSMMGDEDRYLIGDDVEIVYDKLNPSHARLNEYKEICGPFIGCLSINILFLSLGCIGLYLRVVKKMELF